MTTAIATSAEEALTELAERFEQWRQSRINMRERIPEDLWDQAVALSTALSNGRVAKRLRLSPTDLRKQRRTRQGSATPLGTEPSPAFIEIPSAGPWSSTVPGVTEIEITRPDGARMAIRSQVLATSLVTLVRAFLEHA